MAQSSDSDEWFARILTVKVYIHRRQENNHPLHALLKKRNPNSVHSRCQFPFVCKCDYCPTFSLSSLYIFHFHTGPDFHLKPSRTYTPHLFVKDIL